MSRHKEVIHAAENEPAAIFAFDLLMLDGEDMRQRPLIARKAALEPILARCRRIKYASHIEEANSAIRMSRYFFRRDGL